MGTVDKANELVDKFFNIDSEYYESSDDAYIDMSLAKQCALVCVDEMMEFVNPLALEYEYLEEVKLEIDKL